MQSQFGMQCQCEEVRVGVEDLGSGADSDCADQTVDELADGLTVGSSRAVHGCGDLVVGGSRGQHRCSCQ